MKKIISILTVVLALSLLFSVSAFAAETFSVDPDAAAAAGVTLGAVDEDSIAVTVDATDGAYYSVLLVDGTELPTVSSSIAYINQTTAVDSSVTFDVLPLLSSCSDEMTLYIGSNADGANLISFNVSYAETATEVENDYISSEDTDKATIATDVATNGVAVALSSDTMGNAKGSYVISLALDTTAYPNAGNEEAGYIVKAVNADGTEVEGAAVYYSAERKKYVALVPSTATDYKFEVLAADAEGATANGVIAMYGDMNENGTITSQTADFANFKKAYLGNLTDAKKCLIADVSGDGQVATADFANFKKAYLGNSYTFAVLNK